MPISHLFYSACFDSLQLYRGTLENGSSIAIRCLVLSRKFSSQSIRGHLDWMSKLNHPHLLSFLGHCTQTSGEHDPVATILYLVYEYMPNGSYRTHLSGQFGMCSKVNSMSKLNLSVLGNSMLLEYCLFVESFSEKILTWPDRLAILIEIAKAVHFLHTGVMPGSFNNHLKTNNILLDEHKIAKLSDYGVSAIIEENEKLEVCSIYSLSLCFSSFCMLFFDTNSGLYFASASTFCRQSQKPTSQSMHLLSFY